MVPGRVLAASHEGPGNVDRRFPLDKAHNLRHRVLRGNGEEHVHVIPHHVPLFNPTFLLLCQRAEDLPEMPPQRVVERFPTILRDKHYMILAVPCGMAESLAVGPDKLPLGETLSDSLEGVCGFDSRNCQTLGVPRLCRGCTLIKSHITSAARRAPACGDTTHTFYRSPRDSHAHSALRADSGNIRAVLRDQFVVRLRRRCHV